VVVKVLQVVGCDDLLVVWLLSVFWRWY